MALPQPNPALPRPVLPPPPSLSHHAESQGLQVSDDVLWTKNVWGFWNVSIFELLFRADKPKQPRFDRFLSGCGRVSGGDISNCVTLCGPASWLDRFVTCSCDLLRFLNGCGRVMWLRTYCSQMCCIVWSLAMHNTATLYAVLHVLKR